MPMTTSFSRFRISRRTFVHGAGAASLAAIPVAAAVTNAPAQNAPATPSPSSVPPTVTPTPIPPTPTPDPIPAHKLTIVTSDRPAYSGAPQTTARIRVTARQDQLTAFCPVLQRQDMQIQHAILEPLYAVDPETLAETPLLLDHVTWSRDGKQAEFRIKPGVVFSDGSPLTANDVAFSWTAYRDDLYSIQAAAFGLVSSITAKDDRTVAVEFFEPDVAFMTIATLQPIFQQAQHAAHWESRPVGSRTLVDFDYAATPLIGTGPFMVSEVTDTTVRLKKNPHYWNGDVWANELEFIGFADNAARVDAWVNGDVDIATGLTSADLAPAWSRTGLLLSTPSLTSAFLAYNFDNPFNPTADMMASVALRKSLARAVDRKKLADIAFLTFLDDATRGPVPQPWLADDAPAGPDLDAARKLLDDGGWIDRGAGIRSDEKGNPLDLYVVMDAAERSDVKAAAQLLQDAVIALNGRISFGEMPAADLADYMRTQRIYDMHVVTMPLYPVFNEWDMLGSAWDVRTNATGLNLGGYASEAVDDAIDGWFAVRTTGGVAPALRRLQQAEAEDPFALWLGRPRDLTLVRDGVWGVVPNGYNDAFHLAQVWAGKGSVVLPIDPATPEASPAASPVATPQASPVIG